MLTHDDDFLRLSETEHGGVLFVPDSGMPPEKVADSVNEISKHLSQDEIESVVYVTEGWL